MSDLLITRTGDVGHIRFNLPDTGNKILHSQISKITDQLQEFAADTTLKVVVISGEGAHFCQGRDPGKKDPNAPAPSAVSMRTNMMKPIINVYQALRDIQVPVVAIVQGETHGFGAALAGSCDITIAADNALFSFPELKTNMPPTLAMSTIIDRVPLKTLSWLVYTSKFINAHEAQRAGLVSTVVPLADLQTSADEAIASLAAKDREALIGVKQFLAATQNTNFHEAGLYGANLLANILSSAGK